MEAFLRGNAGVVETSRAVVAMRAHLGEEQNELFYPFVNVDDEALSFPIGDVRAKWSERGLLGVDAERSTVEEFYGAGIVAASEALLSYAKSHAP